MIKEIKANEEITIITASVTSRHLFGWMWRIQPSKRAHGYNPHYSEYTQYPIVSHSTAISHRARQPV